MRDPVMPTAAANAHTASPDEEPGRTDGPRVLHLYRRFHPDYTGDGIYFSRLIPLIATHGSCGEVLVYETPPPDGRATIRHQDLTVHYLAAGQRPSPVALLRHLLARRAGYDVLHLHSHVDRSLFTYLAARMLGWRVLFSCSLDDSPTEVLAGYRPRYRPLVRLLFRTIDRFVVISPQLLRRSLETVSRDRVVFLPQGTILPDRPVDEAERGARKRALDLPEESVVLLNVGSVSRRKGTDWLIEALARLPDPRLVLVVVGPALEEDFSAEVRRRIAELGLEGRVRFVGFRDDPTPYYRAADVFVFASTAEGFPNVLVEAMAHGLPIVMRFLPGLADFLVRPDESGFLAASVEDFAAALSRLAADPELRRRFGRENRRFAERNLDLAAVARSYDTLYRGVVPTSPAPDLAIRFTRDLSAGPTALGLVEMDTPPSWRPQLLVVIDTEAAFEWDKGTYTDVGDTAPTRALERGLDVFRRHGLRPALVVDQPVATNPESAAVIRALADEGCEIGAHLHPWSSPPAVEPRDDWHSFSGNLGPPLERAKLAALTERIAALLGRAPTVFKAGRYGLSAGTVRAIAELGYRVDCSICPAYDYSRIGGPDFSRFSARPGWFLGYRSPILSLPTTAGRIGWLSGVADAAALWPVGRLGRLAARLNALYPVRLSPEGVSLAQMQQLTRKLHARGLRVFTLSLHSPSLSPGYTPYARNTAERDALIARIDAYLGWFLGAFGGEATDLASLYARLARELPPPGR
ncbi:MAG: glycosyltransferase [Elioraea sp.]|nr:glycosyltransferase [Elioraea sp.]